MLKNVHYLLLLLVLTVPTGCEMIKGAGCGLKKDVHNVTNPNKNGWNSLKKTDAWMQENLW